MNYIHQLIIDDLLLNDKFIRRAKNKCRRNYRELFGKVRFQIHRTAWIKYGIELSYEEECEMQRDLIAIIKKEIELEK